MHSSLLIVLAIILLFAIGICGLPELLGVLILSSCVFVYFLENKGEGVCNNKRRQFRVVS